MENGNTQLILSKVDSIKDDVKSSIDGVSKEVVSLGKKIIRVETHIEHIREELKTTKEVVASSNEQRADATARINLLEQKTNKLSSSFKTLGKKPSWPPGRNQSFAEMAKSVGLIITAFVTGVGALFAILYQFGFFD